MTAVQIARARATSALACSVLARSYEARSLGRAIQITGPQQHAIIPAALSARLAHRDSCVTRSRAEQADNSYTSLHGPIGSFPTLVREKFDARTEYDKNNCVHPEAAARLVNLCDLHEGDRVVDLACGTGFVTFLAAEHVGTTGSILGVDISPGMIKQARAKLSPQVSAAIDFRVADIEALQLEEGSQDFVICSSAIVYICDLSGLLRRVHSWLKRPSGVLAYNSPEAPYCRMLPLMQKLLVDREIQGLSFPFSESPDAAAHKDVLKAAGFSDVQIFKTEEMLWEQPVKKDEYAERGWQLIFEGFKPFFPLQDLLDTAQLEQLREDFKTEATVLAKQLADDTGYIKEIYNNLQVVATT